MRGKLILLTLCVCVLSLAGTSPAANIDPSLVGWWMFEDGSGTAAKDVSGKSVDAVFTGGVTWGQDSQRGGILLFNGTTASPQYAFIDGGFNLPVYTMALWFRVDGGSGQRDIFSAYAKGVRHGILLEMQGDGTLRYLHRYPLGTGGGTNIYTTGSYDDGAWYHVAMVKSVDQIALYINGQEVGRTADTSKFNPGDTFGVALGILDNERAAARLFPGAMDDVRIYNRPLSQEEIQAVVGAQPWPYAWSPDPADGALHPDTWVNLSWLPGPFAVSHDVYFSDDLDQVQAGTGDTFRGNQTGTFFVAGFPGFPYPDGLVPGTTYYWRIDEVNDLNPNSPWKGDVWSFTVPSKKAYEPDPPNGAKFIATDVTLTWTPGFGAKLHTVYFGDDPDVVGNATGGSPAVLGSYTPASLEAGKIYYWRVDEFDGTSTYKGDVWSFTTAGTGGGVRGDYFNGTDFASHVLTRTDPQINFDWGDAAPDPAVGADGFSVRWTGEVEAAFTETYTFYTNSDDGVRLWVNGQLLVDNWTDHTNTENSGNIDLVAGNIYSFQMEYYDNTGPALAELLWSSRHTPKQIVPQAALSPPIRASNPYPANGATGTKMTPILTWNAGDYAASHEVYFGTDANAVKNATQASPEFKGTKALGNESYDPGKLAWATTYYWRVDEVNSANPDSPWAGSVWKFSTGDFLLIDNFEDYNAGDNQIWYAWHDGLGYGTPGTPNYFAGNGTGAAVGDETTASFTEETIVHSGKQSMPLAYDNNKQGFAKYSETELTLTAPRDWTEESVAELSIWFRGLPASVGNFKEAPAGTYTMTSTGADIAGTADEFHYAYKMLTGVGSIQAQVLSVDNTNAWTKAGVMIRETLDAGSQFAAVYITPGNGCRFQVRRGTDGAVTSDTPVATDEQKAITAPYWVRLERDFAGNFSASYSADGTTWTPMVWNPQNIAMSSNVYVGLALCSHTNNAVCEAKFSNVTTTGTITGQWAHQDIGIVSNAPEPLYVAVSNAGGQPAVVVNPDPNAATTTTWTEWVIPLSAFSDQGIDLTNIDQLAIGLGTRGNMTTPGGSGKMYFDDIRLYRPKTTP
jgi:PA14 domain/Concanavalin A-like lectin/glucanases superfamily